MSRLKEPREGERLKVKGRVVEYSRFPVIRGDSGYRMQDRIFATNPWSIIRGELRKIDCKKTRRQARRFVLQAEDFYRAYQSAHEVSSKPLLVYYSFLNLVKAYCLHEDVRKRYKSAYHGIHEEVRQGGKEFDDSYLKFHRSDKSQVNIFADFYQAFFGKRLQPRFEEREYDLAVIHPQILQGHRIWASSIGDQERFLEIGDIHFLQNECEKSIWMVVNIFHDDLSRFDISRRNFLGEGGNRKSFIEVKSTEDAEGRKILRFEQQKPITYTRRPSDVLEEMVSKIRNNIWSTVTITHPYRKNYFYMSPEDEMDYRLPQILSIYAFIYYLGSVTRYRPDYFVNLLNRSYGSHIEVTFPPN